MSPNNKPGTRNRNDITVICVSPNASPGMCFPRKVLGGHCFAPFSSLLPLGISVSVPGKENGLLFAVKRNHNFANIKISIILRIEKDQGYVFEGI